MEISPTTKKLEKELYSPYSLPFFYLTSKLLDFTTSVIEFGISSDKTVEFNASARNMMVKYGALKGLIFYDTKYLWPIELCFLTYLISIFLDKRIKSPKLKNLNKIIKGISTTDLMIVGGAHFLSGFWNLYFLPHFYLYYSKNSSLPFTYNLLWGMSILPLFVILANRWYESFKYWVNLLNELEKIQ